MRISPFVWSKTLTQRGFMETNQGSIGQAPSAPIAAPESNGAVATPAQSTPDFSGLPPTAPGYKYVQNASGTVSQVAARTLQDQINEVLREANGTNQPATQTNAPIGEPVAPTTSIPSAPESTAVAPQAAKQPTSDPVAIRITKATELINSGDPALRDAGYAILDAIRQESKAEAPAQSQPAAPVFDRDAVAADLRNKIKAQLIAEARKPKYEQVKAFDADGNEVVFQRLVQGADGNPVYEEPSENDWLFKNLLDSKTEMAVAKAENEFRSTLESQRENARAYAALQSEAEETIPSLVYEAIPEAQMVGPAGNKQLNRVVFEKYEAAFKKEVAAIRAEVAAQGKNFAAWVEAAGGIKRLVPKIHNVIMEDYGDYLRVIARETTPQRKVEVTQPNQAAGVKPQGTNTAPFTVPPQPTTTSNYKVPTATAGANPTPAAATGTSPMPAPPEPLPKFGTFEYQQRANNVKHMTLEQQVRYYRNLAQASVSGAPV